MQNVLIISGHPDLETSLSNRTIITALEAHFGAESIRRIDRLYPNFIIDVEIEQQALLFADIIIFQTPFHWYALPALMKKWLDDVFTFNFAYGSKGDKLKGKHFILSVTVGGPAESYGPDGYNHYRLEDLLLPIQQTVQLTGMHYHPPIYSCGLVYIPGIYGDINAITQKAQAQAEKLITAVESLAEKV